MAALKERENYIPLHKNELAEALLASTEMSAQDRDGFRAYCRLVSLLFHLEYFQRLENLKASYSPFDPDSGAMPLFQLSAEERLQRQNSLFNDVAQLLEEANYRHLSRDEIVASLRTASAWGLRMEVDFHLFERMAILVRGECTEKRPLRRIRKAMLRENVEVPIYQRVVMLLKMRPNNRHVPRQVDTEHIYLQLFKNIPRLDINMLLPGARARMDLIDRTKIVLPILTGLGLTAWQIVRDIETELRFLNDAMALKTAAVWAVASAAFGYGLKSFYNYQQTRQSYNLSLTQVLYYQNLDTNSGVLYRLLDEAEEQDCREAMLGYFFLWRYAGENGWTTIQLQQQVEQALEKMCALKFRFDTSDCLPRLERYRLVEKLNGHYRAMPLARSLETLEQMWMDAARSTPKLATPIPT